VFQKIFNVSLHRCATQSVHDLLARSGVSSIHWPGVIDGVNYQEIVKGREKELGYVTDTLAPVIALTTALNDVPIAALYDHLDKLYANSAFLLIYRSPFDWVRSVRSHVGDRELNPFERVQYWRYLPDQPPSLCRLEESMLYSLHLTHHKEVLEYFQRRANFLFVDVQNPEAGQRICNFLGLRPIVLRHIDFRRGNGVTTRTKPSEAR
jgi:hypothetical protein